VQLHKVEKQKNNRTSWINLVYQSGKKYKDLGRKVLSSTLVILFEQITYVLMFSYFYMMVFDPRRE